MRKDATMEKDKRSNRDNCSIGKALNLAKAWSAYIRAIAAGDNFASGEIVGDRGAGEFEGERKANRLFGRLAGFQSRIRSLIIRIRRDFISLVFIDNDHFFGDSQRSTRCPARRRSICNTHG